MKNEKSLLGRFEAFRKDLGTLLHFKNILAIFDFLNTYSFLTEI